MTIGNKTSVPNIHFGKRIVKEQQQIHKEFIAKEWHNHSNMTISITELGCGSGSAISYLGSIEFLDVE